MLSMNSRFTQLLSEAGRWFAVLLLVALAAAPARAQVLNMSPGQVSAINSLSGSANPAYTGPASGLALNGGQALAFDAQGDLFLVDAGESVVRVIASGKGPIPVLPSVASPVAGNVYTVAGKGTSSASSTPLCSSDQKSSADGNYYGNGCSATSAVFNFNGAYSPATGLAFDAEGNLYITDTDHNQVRVVYASGSVPGLPAGLTPGYVYAFAGVASSNGAYSGDGGSALSAQLNGPHAVAVDPSGNVYIGDYWNHVLRVVYGGVALPSDLPTTAAAGNIFTLEPGGVKGPWSGITALASDANGNIYVGGPNSYYVFTIYAGKGSIPGISNPVTGTVYEIAGNNHDNPSYGPYGVPATDLAIVFPGQISIDPAGDVYVADFYQQGSASYITKIDTSGIGWPVVGSSNPFGNCSNDIDGSGDGCPSNQVGPYDPFSVVVGSDGNVYYTDDNPNAFSNNTLLHEVQGNAGNLSFTSTAGVPSTIQTVQVSNVGDKNLQFTAIQATGPFSQVSAGSGTNCTASTVLLPGQNCQLSIAFTPPDANSSSGSLTIASNSTNATNGRNTIVLSGTSGVTTTSTVLAATPTLANPGQPVTLTASIVLPTGDTLAATGTVKFLNGTTTVGTAAVSQNIASITLNSLPAGTYTYTASYSGDSNYSTSTSYAATFTVSSQQVPTVTVSGSASSIDQGQPVTFTATVTPYSGSVVPTGTVTFTDGLQNALGSAPLNGSGVATLTTFALPAGDNTVFAEYGGDSTYAASGSATGVAVHAQGSALLTLAPGTISTIAGTYGVTGFGGDGGSATGPNAKLQRPRAVSADSYGNVYFADSGNARIRVVASGSGIVPGVANPVAGGIYTVAGKGSACANNSGILSCGDGGPATSAGLSPFSVSADGFGNVYISDYESSVGLVRKVDPSGIISTVAGNLNTSASPQNLGDEGPATSAKLSIPYGLRTDSRGNLYIADVGSALVRRVDGLTGIITTVAGSQPLGRGYSGDGSAATEAQLKNPTDVALDIAGNLFITDSGNNVIRRVDAKTGIITTVAGDNQLGAVYAGDGGPATVAGLGYPYGATLDAAGDLYIADTDNAVIRRVDALTGIITTVAGIPSAPTGASGDGGLATSAHINQPYGVALDSSGNLLIADYGDNVIRQLTTTAATAPGFGNQPLGSTTTQTFTVSSTGGQALSISSIDFPNGYIQQASGGADCTAPMTLNPGQSCELTIGFFPTDAVAFNGSVTIASNSANASSGTNSIAVTGTGVGSGGTTQQTITFAPPATATYGQKITLNATASSGLTMTYLATGPATLSGNTLTVTGVGTITVTAYQFGNQTYANASSQPMKIAASPATLTVTAGNVSCAYGQVTNCIQSLSADYTIAGFVNSDTQAAIATGAPALSTTATASSLSGQYPITITQGTFQFTSPRYAADYTLAFVNGTLTISGTAPQTITFPAIANTTYGAQPITLSAQASSGLPVAYSVVSGPATIANSSTYLTITGAGVVTVMATQPGDSQYAAATSVSQSFVVSPEALTFTANNQTMAQGSAVPQLTYVIGGLKNGDTAAEVVSGLPILITTATSSSPAGTVAPITITQGSLTTLTANYALSPSSFVSGTLTVVTGSSQTIAFSALPQVTYGTAPITLIANTSSGLPVSFTVTGPAALANNLLTVLGAGTITVTATQSGNATYTAAAPVQQIFTVAPAPLTVTANNATRVNDTVNPPFTYGITGFVNGDTAAVLSGFPVLSTTATAGSPVGTYPIIAGAGSLTAANYAAVNFVPGTLTITSGGPAQDFAVTMNPQQMTIVAGQIQQTVISVASTNYYQGLVNLSCKSLPANVSCVFTPAALSVASGTAATQGTLTITTGGTTVVSSQVPADRGIRVAAVTGWLSLLFGVIFAWRRKRLARYTSVWTFALAAVLFGAVASITACGGHSSSSSTGNGLAAPGTSTIQIVAADSSGGPSHSIDLVLTVR